MNDPYHLVNAKSGLLIDKKKLIVETRKSFYITVCCEPTEPLNGFYVIDNVIQEWCIETPPPPHHCYT